MYILYTVLYKENLFNSNEYLQLLIISFILMTLMFWFRGDMLREKLDVSLILRVKRVKFEDLQR